MIVMPVLLNLSLYLPFLIPIILVELGLLAASLILARSGLAMPKRNRTAMSMSALKLRG